VADDRAAGLENLSQGSAMLEQLTSEDPKNLRVRRLLGLSYSRAAEILLDDSKAWPRALALYKKALATKQGLVVAEPTNADFQRLVAYDQFAMAELLASMRDNNAALSQDRAALSTFQKLSATDPANAQFQQDIGRVLGQMGQVLINMGEPSSGIEQLGLSLSTLEKLPDFKNPQTLAGFAFSEDELWMGKAEVVRASHTASQQQAAQHCREAEVWFAKCLPAFQTLRDQAPAQYGGAARVDEINRETARCKQAMKTANHSLAH
jgi:tetratricopeptide (TPR) repeat protein